MRARASRRERQRGALHEQRDMDFVGGFVARRSRLPIGNVELVGHAFGHAGRKFSPSRLRDRLRKHDPIGRGERCDGSVERERRSRAMRSPERRSPIFLRGPDRAPRDFGSVSSGRARDHVRRRKLESGGSSREYDARRLLAAAHLGEVSLLWQAPPHERSHSVCSVTTRITSSSRTSSARGSSNETFDFKEVARASDELVERSGQQSVVFGAGDVRVCVSTPLDQSDEGGALPEAAPRRRDEPQLPRARISTRRSRSSTSAAARSSRDPLEDKDARGGQYRSRRDRDAARGRRVPLRRAHRLPRVRARLRRLRASATRRGRRTTSASPRSTT